MKAVCKKGIDYSTPMHERSEEELAEHAENMKALTYYNKKIRAKECESVLDMINDEDEWEQGQSQGMHIMVMTARVYNFDG